MLDSILTIAIVVAFPLLIVLLHKLKIVDASAGVAMLQLMKDGFKEDYETVEEGGYAAMMKKRWHLHGLVGLGTVFTMLMPKSVFTMPFWQILILIPLVSFLIQAAREFALAVYKKIPSDLSDARFGMYYSFLGTLLYGLLSLFITFNIWIFALISVIIYGYVAYAVFVKKQ